MFAGKVSFEKTNIRDFQIKTTVFISKIHAGFLKFLVNLKIKPNNCELPLT